jgi:hypothetical protein
MTLASLSDSEGTLEPGAGKAVGDLDLEKSVLVITLPNILDGFDTGWDLKANPSPLHFNAAERSAMAFTVGFWVVQLLIAFGFLLILKASRMAGDVSGLLNLGMKLLAGFSPLGEGTGDVRTALLEVPCSHSGPVAKHEPFKLGAMTDDFEGDRVGQAPGMSTSISLPALISTKERAAPGLLANGGTP